MQNQGVKIPHSPPAFFDALLFIGVGIIVMCSGKAKEAGGQLRVAGAEGHVKTVLKITEVGKILALVEIDPNGAFY